MASRRTFFGSLVAGLAAAPALPRQLAARLPASDEWDLRWLLDLTGEHRQVFDIGLVQDGQLHVVKNWLNAHNEVYKLGDNQLSAVVGLASKGFPANANDALYERYPIGESYKITDPETGTWARRNLFVHSPKGWPAEQGVPALVARGVVFWMCNNALHGVAQRLAPKGNAGEVYADLRANLLPHVKLVPAHTMLVGLCQEHGCTYEALP